MNQGSALPGAHLPGCHLNSLLNFQKVDPDKTVGTSFPFLLSYSLCQLSDRIQKKDWLGGVLFFLDLSPCQYSLESRSAISYRPWESWIPKDVWMLFLKEIWWRLSYFPRATNLIRKMNELVVAIWEPNGEPTFKLYGKRKWISVQLPHASSLERRKGAQGLIVRPLASS